MIFFVIFRIKPTPVGAWIGQRVRGYPDHATATMGNTVLCREFALNGDVSHDNGAGARVHLVLGFAFLVGKPFQPCSTGMPPGVPLHQHAPCVAMHRRALHLHDFRRSTTERTNDSGFSTPPLLRPVCPTVPVFPVFVRAGLRGVRWTSETVRRGHHRSVGS